MRDIRIIIILCFFAFGLRAQTAEQLLKETETHLLKKLGKNAMKQNDPNSAIIFFETFIKTNKTDYDAFYLLGKAYMQVRNYEKANQFLLKAHQLQKGKKSDALFYQAQMMKSLAKYDSAKYYFDKFKKEYKGSNRAMKKQATLEVTYCDSIQKLTKDTYKTIVTKLDSSINKVNSESAPISISNNEVVFASLRTNKKEYIFEDDSAEGAKRKLYLAERKGNKWVFKGEYGSLFNDEKYNVGNAAFSRDKKRMYFTKCHINDQEQMICAIYVSEKVGEKWSEPKRLPKPINERKSSSTMPAIGSDAKGNDIIYFVSNRSGGKGGYDIWSTTYDKKNNEYKTPKNLGTKINTAGTEMSPFFDHETHSLYFSSNGLLGLGGYDIFKATGDGKRWLSIENIGKPFNSGTDDIYYSIATQHDEGFFVSNRKGGAALVNATCCDDIYHYKIKESIFVNLNGTVAQEGNSKKPLSNAKIEIYSVDKVTKAKYLVKTVTTDSLGNYKTFLEPNKLYEVVVRKKDFLGKSEEVSTVGYSAGQDLVKKMKIEKSPINPISLPNINYEFNSAELNKKAKRTIDSLVITFLNLNPSIIIELHSHTDNKGNDDFNLTLSQKRAESIVKYLIDNGINSKRLVAIGFGEKEPIAPNQNSDGTDNPKGRAKNRRTDMKVIGELEEE